jgi:hypothetical protein
VTRKARYKWVAGRSLGLTLREIIAAAGRGIHGKDAPGAGKVVAVVVVIEFAGGTYWQYNNEIRATVTKNKGIARAATAPVVNRKSRPEVVIQVAL